MDSNHSKRSEIDDRALEQHALLLLRENVGYLADARQYSLNGESVCGAALSQTLGISRDRAERSVRAALAEIDEGLSS